MAKLPTRLPDDLIKPEEAAPLAGTTTLTLARERCERDPRTVPFYRIGLRRIRYSRREVLAWVAAQRVDFSQEER